MLNPQGFSFFSAEKINTTIQKMNIAIINTLSVPSGNASVNRLLSYAKGMVEGGDDVSVLSSAFSNYIVGDINGVKYHNYGKGNGVISLFIALLQILKVIWNAKYDAVILVSNSLMLIYPLAIVCKLRGIKYLQEKSEFPFVLMKKGLLAKIWAWFYTSTTYKLFDGLIVMTKPLMDYFVTKVRKNCKLIEVPMTVDLDRFTIEKNQEAKYGDYIAYCGNMAGNKDGVMNLIEAFDIASKQIQKVKLLLIGGSTTPEDLVRIKDFAKDKGDGRIIFYGKATREEIPSLLVNAKVLALARPSCLQSTGGFPTKLGEYLATSNPVVVTAVGDIPRYLNETNSYLVEPDNNKAFAEGLVKIFSNYPTAQDIGKRGRKVAEQNFNYKVQAPRIHDFIERML